MYKDPLPPLATQDLARAERGVLGVFAAMLGLGASLPLLLGPLPRVRAIRAPSRKQRRRYVSLHFTKSGPGREHRFAEPRTPSAMTVFSEPTRFVRSYMNSSERLRYLETLSDEDAVEAEAARLAWKAQSIIARKQRRARLTKAAA